VEIRQAEPVGLFVAPVERPPEIIEARAQCRLGG